jgi:hypothetical protein
MRSGSGLFFALLIGACAPDDPGESSSTANTSVASDSLMLALHVPVRAPRSSAIPITLAATNPTNRTLELHLGGRDITFDIIVHDEQGRQVWRRLENVAVQSILRLEPIAAGATLELRDVWTPNMMPPGRYTVTASVPTEAAPLLFGPATISLY